ncbi:YciI family protein [Microbispora hainanensis]|uniref:YciI family protein n=1 Tax=Microbispora hainanensis TaxID=568844 RepID=UPI00324EC728
MPHVVIVSYTGSEEDAAPFVRDHVAYLERHHADGVFLVSGPTVPSSQGGAILAHGVDRETIERISAEDPFVENGVATHTITTIEPGRVHPALAAPLTAAPVSQN